MPKIAQPKTAKKLAPVALLSFSLALSGCGYNRLQALDEQTDAQWAEVINQYQRRADLTPNLVATVQAYADHEQSVFADVAAARAQIGSVQIDSETPNDPAALAQYQQAQGQMSSALSRLLAISERYPELKADGVFLDLQAQLEGTENRIGEARRRYILSVQQYNTAVRQFPSNLTAKIFGMSTKPNFSVENEQSLSVAPRVAFGNANDNAQSAQ